MIVQGGTRQVHAYFHSQPGAAAGDHCAAELTVAAEGYVQPQAGCLRSSTRLVLAGHCGPRAAKNKRVGGTCHDVQRHVAVTWIRRRQPHGRRQRGAPGPTRGATASLKFQNGSLYDRLRQLGKCLTRHGPRLVEALGMPRHGGWSPCHREGARRDRATLATLGLEGIFPSRVVGASKAARHRKPSRHLAAGTRLGRCQHLRPKGDGDLFGGTRLR